MSTAETSFAALIFVVGICFVAWGLWVASWGLYDHLMQQRTRKRLRKFDARVGRVCFTDKKGIWR